MKVVPLVVIFRSLLFAVHFFHQANASSQPSKPIQIELPLLLGTSRLIKEFSTPLPSKSRIISAAQVQALRLKKRYEAFVGDVSEDKKLQLWALPQTP